MHKKPGQSGWIVDSRSYISKQYKFVSGTIYLDLFFQGDDLLVRLYGGDEPHIGAIALAIPRPSLKDPEVVSATTSVFTITSHKDDEIAVPLAAKIAADCNRVVTAVVGIHVDNIELGVIKEIIGIAKKAAQDIVEELNNSTDIPPMSCLKSLQ